MIREWRHPDHERWDELAVGHALHALEPEDEEAFLGHLRGCAHCEGTLAEMEAAAADLAYAAPPLEPPDRLRRRVAEIAGTEDRPTALSLGRRRHAGRPGGRVARSSWAPGWAGPWMGVAAGLVLVIALGVWNLVLQADNSAKQDRLDQAAAVLRCVEDPECHQVRLAHTDTNDPVGAVLVRGDRVDLVVDGLEPNDRRATAYVLWQGTPAGDMLAVGAFDVTCRDVCVVSVDRDLPQSWELTTRFAVSKEASRTPPAEPAPPVAVGEVDPQSA